MGRVTPTRNSVSPTRDEVSPARDGVSREHSVVPRGRNGSAGTLFAPLLSGLRAVLDMFYGATIYEMVRDLNKERSRLENMFALVVFGDLLGIPILPPYYTLKLLPYVMPRIPGWRASLLRERDLTDLCDQEIT